MPTILPSFTYTDGALLDSDGHSRNVYDTASGRGLMSTTNGDLDQGNLDTTFRVRSEHILPQLKIRTSDSFALDQIDCFEDAFAANVSQGAFNFNDAPSSFWNPVPGCGLRFYLPSQSQCLLRLGFFCHPFKIGYAASPLDATTSASVFDMAVAWKIDGVLQNQTKRPLVNTARYKTAAVAATAGYTTAPPSNLLYTQRRAAAWYDMHMLKLLEPGVHDVQLCLYMESVNISRVPASAAEDASSTTGHVKLARHRYSFSDKQADGTTDASQYGIVEKRNAHLLFQRATFGVRSARVLAFGT